ncbi:MAG: HAD family phosphatase [Candidatus Sungbacteria bacterium]|nr:HAD family phosphatase [Candidatus Sungbacteria bacterium]
MFQNGSLKKKVAIFDLDGVIINSEAIFDIADTEFFYRRGIHYKREEVISIVIGKGLRESTAILKKIYTLKESIEGLLEERRKILAEAYATRIDFMGGFKKFHTALIEKNIRTCIATASDNELLAIVDRKLGLSEIFRGKIFTIADVQHKSKPDPAIFLYAAHRVGAVPDECVVIEDSPNGILAAKNADMLCIALTTTHARDKLNLADVIVDTFHEIHIGEIFTNQSHI